MILGVVPSLNTENVYFLFTQMFEKTIITDQYKRIKNLQDFTVEERNYLQTNKFKIY